MNLSFIPISNSPCINLENFLQRHSLVALNIISSTSTCTIIKSLLVIFKRRLYQPFLFQNHFDGNNPAAIPLAKMKEEDEVLKEDNFTLNTKNNRTFFILLNLLNKLYMYRLAKAYI